MNFKQLVLEELINYDHITFTIKGKVWMNDYTGVVMPTPTEGVSSTAVYCFKDNKNGTWWVKKIENWQRFNETPKDQNYQVIQEPSWYKREKGGYKRGVERFNFFKKLQFEIAPKLIDIFELKQTLTPDTRKTFGDLVDEL
jgi:glycogen synthase